MKVRSVCVFLALFSVSLPAMAYIDPGSGSAILSAFFGIFVAVGLVVKNYWYKLKSLFTRNKKEQNTDEKPEEPKEL